MFQPVANTQDVFAQINPIDDALFASDRTTATYCRMPFYRDFVLLKLEDPAWPITAFYLTDWSVYHRLDGNTVHIHAVNRLESLHLTRDTVMYYFVFMCAYLRADGHPFVLIMDDIADAPPEMKARMEAMEPEIIEENDDGFVFKAHMGHRGRVFQCRVTVSRDGHCAMTDDAVIDPVPFKPYPALALSQLRVVN